jgi:hypothetical protein
MRLRLLLSIAIFTTGFALVGCRVDARHDESEATDEALLPSLPGTTTVYEDKFMIVVSDRPLDRADASGIAAEIRTAYEFDTRYQGWSSPALAAPMQVAIVSDPLMKKVTGQAGGGICWDKDSFFTDGSILSARPATNAFEAFVVAHELEHMHMERLGAREPRVPVYAFEGIACVLGDWFVDLQRQVGVEALVHAEAHGLARFGGDDARDLFLNFSTGYGDESRLYWHEHLGGLFFEFVRAHVCANPDDVLLDWGALTLAVGQGTSFEDAFLAAYGTSLADAQAQFISFMDETRSSPKTRFKGTVWEGFE